MKRRDLFTKPDREQVPFNLSAPAITGKPFQAGQYSVAVQSPVPASQTSLGKLAATLGQVNPAIRAYGQAQQASTDLQKTMFGLDFAQMTEKEKDLAAQRLKSEEKFNSKLRGDGYELNPVAQIYAKELIGADKSDEYMAFIEENKAKYIEDEVVVKGVKPSPMQINEFVEGLTTKFKEENADTMADPLMLSGFMRSTSAYRNQASVQIAKEASDIHKNEVLIPQAAKALSRVSQQPGIQIVNEEERKSRYQEAWAKTGPLTAADQKLVIATWVNSMKPDLAQLKLEELADSGITVGNEPLRAEDPIGDTYYNNLQDELEDKALVERQEVIKEDNLVKNEAFNQYTETFGSKEYLDLSYGEKQEFQEDLKREVESIEDNTEAGRTERRRKLAGLTLAINKESIKRDKDVYLVEKMARDSGSVDMGAFGRHALGKVKEVVDEYLKNEKLAKEDPIYNVLKEYVNIEAAAYNSSAPNTFNVGSPQYKTVELLGGFRRDLSVFKEELAERLVDAREGDSIRIGGKDYEISEDNTLISKQKIFDTVMLEEQGKAFERINIKFKDLIEDNKNELEARAEVVKQKTARNKKVEDLTSANKEKRKDLGIIREEPGNLFSPGGYYRTGTNENVYIGGDSFQKIGAEGQNWTAALGAWDRLIGLVPGVQGGDRAHSLTTSHLNAFESGLATGAYLLPDKEGKMSPTSADAPLLFANIRDNYKNLKPILVADFNHFQELFTKDGNLDDLMSLRHTGNAILQSRKFVGFSALETIDAIAKGVISEGVDIMQNTPDGVSYFERELLGENPEGRALTIINYDNKEELQGIAEKLGTDVDTLDEAQQKARQYYNGEMLPDTVRKLQQEIERKDKPLRKTIDKQPAPTPTPEKTTDIPTVPTGEDILKSLLDTVIQKKAPQNEGEVKIDAKVSTTEEEEPPADAPEPEPKDKQLELPLKSAVPVTNKITIPKDSKIGKPIQNLKSTYEKAGAKYNINPAFLMAISIVETGHGKSSAFKTKKNAMGVTDKKIVRTFTKVEDSINHMAKILADPNGPYAGLTTVDQLATKYAPAGAANDVNKTNPGWPKLVKKLMKQLNQKDADTLNVVTRAVKKQNSKK